MPQPYKLFTIYAREDEQYLKELLGQLRPLELAGRIKVWSDREINPGVEWEKAIVQKLDTADIILILVSAAYYSSVYIHDVEIKYAISRHEQGVARVLPVIVRPCSFLDDPVISKLQVLPTDGNAVTDRRHWHERDDAWLDVVAGVKRTLDLLLAAEMEKEKSAREAALAVEQAAEQKRLAALAAKQETERQKKEAKLAEQLDQKKAEAERLTDEQRTHNKEALIKQKTEDLSKQQAQISRKQEEHERLERQRRELGNATQRADQRVWRQALKEDNLDAYKFYLTQYPQGEYAREARFRIKELKRDDATPLPVGRYAAYGAGVLALLLAIWLAPKIFGREKDVPEFLMVPVAGGTFMMGSPENEEGRDSVECQHKVRVESFSMGKYEVTQAQWKSIMGNNPSEHKGCDDCPVENVSWNDIQQFLQKLNTATGKHYRLPTEAEWEFAARGGKKSGKYLYAGSNNLSEIAWYDKNSKYKSHSVGGKTPNELGLYDLSGNVWEWCEDICQPYPCDRKIKEDGRRQVTRGGSFAHVPSCSRAARRNDREPAYRDGSIGFRLASSPQ